MYQGNNIVLVAPPDECNLY